MYASLFFISLKGFYSFIVDNLGLMPYRRQIVAVSKSLAFFTLMVPIIYLFFSVGKPIHVQQCDKPSMEEIMRVQKKYIEELTRSIFSFNFFKEKFIIFFKVYGTPTKIDSPRHD